MTNNKLSKLDKIYFQTINLAAEFEYAESEERKYNGCLFYHGAGFTLEKIENWLKEIKSIEKQLDKSKNKHNKNASSLKNYADDITKELSKTKNGLAKRLAEYEPHYGRKQFEDNIIKYGEWFNGRQLKGMQLKKAMLEYILNPDVRFY